MMEALDVGTDKVLANIEDGVGWLTFNNPARHNALSREMLAAIPLILRTFDADDAVKVIVARGAGGKAFVSGADISEMDQPEPEQPERSPDVPARQPVDMWEAWDDLEKPVLALIDGYCLGAGVITALHADIRIASDRSQFGVPAARLGLAYPWKAVQQLRAVVGPAWAAELLFAARRISAVEALSIGLVTAVWPAAEIDARVRELALSIAVNAPLSMRAAKVALREGLRDPQSRSVARAEELAAACYRSEDFREGQRAFLEHRQPNFSGH